MSRFIFSIFLFLSFSAFSQDDEYMEPVDTNEIHGGNGYLITMEKDTLFGYLEYKPYTMKVRVMFINPKTGRSKIYSNNQALKYTIGDRVLVSIPSQFVELIYKGEKANLYKLIEPVNGVGMLVSVASQGWVKTNYFWYKKGVTKRINKITKKKVFLEEVINEDRQLVEELKDLPWRQIKNDSTLISIFQRYNK